MKLPTKGPRPRINTLDRKSTRLNSSHLGISYAVFCLKKKNVRRSSSWSSTDPGRRGKKNEALKLALENPPSLKAEIFRIADKHGAMLRTHTLRRLLTR